jgi:hypothetical protein
MSGLNPTKSTLQRRARGLIANDLVALVANASLPRRTLTLAYATRVFTYRDRPVVRLRFSSPAHGGNG